MEENINLYSLNVNKLNNSNLGGLCRETINEVENVKDVIGSLGISALGKLVSANDSFRVNLVTQKTSPFTEQITEFDRQRDEAFLEIWRTVKTATKSSIEVNAAAAKVLDSFLSPYHGVAKEPLMSETSKLVYLKSNFDADPELQTSAETLQLTAIFNTLFAANEKVDVLWSERALDDAKKNTPAPSTLRANLEKAYNSFCNVILQTIRLQPSPELETLFSVLNEIRIKYAKSLPFKLTNANTVVEPVAMQSYTGKAITPIPRVSIRKENNEFFELQFTVDFYVTYKNNVEIGEAQILIHGKGKYSGSYTSTFHIEQRG
jgi:hypothetical protein